MTCEVQAALALQPAQQDTMQKALMRRDAALDLVARRRRRLVSDLQAAAATKHCDVGNITLACTVQLGANVLWNAMSTFCFTTCSCSLLMWALALCSRYVHLQVGSAFWTCDAQARQLDCLNRRQTRLQKTCGTSKPRLAPHVFPSLTLCCFTR